MAETSLFAQRLQAITERRRLQERILALRRELEEERLRAQRLKRKSLRDRWLMEGMYAPPDDSNHTSSVCEAHSRIQELEQDLSSLQSQMQQLDNPEQQSANSVKEILVTSPPPPEGRSTTEPTLELAPVPPKRMMRTSAEDKLQNGEMSGDGTFAIQPALQSQNPNEAHPSHPRKLAVEEMVIRDHLGQAVGSMDAVGQKQGSIGKEEDLENNVLLGNGCDEGKISGPLCDVSKEEEIPSSVEGQGGRELGCRHGPEGQSPTSLDQEDASRPLKDKATSLESSKEQGDGELPKEAVLVEEGEKGLPVENAVKMEHPQVLAADPASAAEPSTCGQQHQVNLQSLPDCPGAEAVSQGEGGKELEDLHVQTKPPLPDQSPAIDETKFPDALEEIEVSLQSPIILSSPEQIAHTIQDTKPSLPEPISSVEEKEGPLLEPKASLLPNQGPSTVLDQTITLEGSQGSLGAQIPSLVQESLLDPGLTSLQDCLPSPEDQKPFEAGNPSLEETNISVLEQIPSHGAEKDHLEQIPTSLQEPGVSLLTQSLPPLPDQLTSLPEKTPSPLQEMQELPQEPASLQLQEPSVLEAVGHVSGVSSSLTNELPPLPDQTSSAQEPGRVSLEEIPVELQDQMAAAPGTQSSSLQDDDSSVPGQKHPSSVVKGEHLPLEETSASAPDPASPAVQDREPPSPQGKSPSLPEAEGPPAEQMETSLPSPTAPGLPEARKTPPGQGPPPLGEEMPTPLQSQASPVREVTGCQGNQIPPALAEERPTLPDQQPLSSHRAPSPALQEASAVPEASSQEPLQPLLDKTAAGEDEEKEESGGATLASRAAGVGGSPDLLENVPSEQQPLLNELKASAAPAEISVGDQEPKPGALKLQATAGGQEAPTYHTSSANTASSRQLRPPQGEGQDQGQSRRKQKSCQCCSVM